MFNFAENFRLINIFDAASVAAADAAANAPSASGVDLWASGGRPDKVALLIQVTSVGSGGVLDLIVQDSVDGSTWDADFAIIEQISETGVYLVVINCPKQHLRVNYNTTTNAVAFGIMLLTVDERTRPVTQAMDALAVTYADNRLSEPAT